MGLLGGSGKIRHQLDVIWGCTLAINDLFEGQEQDFYIEPKTLILDVPHVQAEFFLPTDRASAIDLSPAGDAWPDVVPAGLLTVIQGKIFHQQWTWPDQAHFASQNIEEAR